IADLLFAARPAFASVYLHCLEALPLDLQQRLCQRLQAEDEISPRICAGLEHDPAALLAAGTLLDELYCGLSALVLHVPALKERMEDFTGLVERLLARAGRAAERTVRGCSGEANELLRTHAWPGNLRELYDVLVGACLRARGELIEAGDLPFYLRHAP